MVKSTATDTNSSTAISAMNTAIENYNSTAEEGYRCNYRWEWNGDDWPKLVNLSSGN